MMSVFRDFGVARTCRKVTRTYRILSYVYQKIRKDLTFVNNYGTHKHPFKKTIDTLKIDLPFISKEKRFIYPEHADVVIIGGGHIGSAIAYALKTRAGEGLSVVILEKDITFEQTKKKTSFGTLTQHFSLPENINLSMYGLDFMRNAKEHLGNDCDLQYMPTGSLVLASEKYAERLEENVKVLNEIGVKNKILSASDINNKFPWINTQDVKLGCMAVEAEGIFNSQALLNGLINKSQELGATYINAEVIGFELEKQKDVLMEGVAPGTYERITKVVYKTQDNEEYSIKFAICVLAAGSNSKHIAEYAKIGTGKDILEVKLPVEKRECNVYTIDGKAAETGLCTPMVMDTTGLWLMRNGLSDNLWCGHVPMMTDDTKSISEEDFFNNIIQPSLLNRVPNIKSTEIKKYVKERFDCNTFDNSGVLGMHPYHNNLLFACGYGRLGCQHAPGLGRAISELIIDSKYTTIDLTRFNFDRFLTMESVVEFNIY